jgi:hypothetical protein
VKKINVRGGFMSATDEKNTKENNNEKYRFGMGIELVDTNIISGPDIERVVNNEMIGSESTSTNKSEK